MQNQQRSQQSSGQQAGQATPSDVRAQADLIKDMLATAARQAREDGRMVQDQQARALFETTAETLDGLIKAYDDFATRSEPAWQ